MASDALRLPLMASDWPSRHLPSIAQMLKMGAGFNSYSTVTSSAPAEAAAAPPAAATAAGPAATAAGAAGAAAAEPTGAIAGAGDELVDLLLAADGTYVLAF